MDVQTSLIFFLNKITPPFDCWGNSADSWYFLTQERKATTQTHHTGSFTCLHNQTHRLHHVHIYSTPPANSGRGRHGSFLYVLHGCEGGIWVGILQVGPVSTLGLAYSRVNLRLVLWPSLLLDFSKWFDYGSTREF